MNFTHQNEEPIKMSVIHWKIHEDHAFVHNYPEHKDEQAQFMEKI